MKDVFDLFLATAKPTRFIGLNLEVQSELCFTLVGFSKTTESFHLEVRKERKLPVNIKNEKSLKHHIWHEKPFFMQISDGICFTQTEKKTDTQYYYINSHTHSPSVVTLFYSLATTTSTNHEIHGVLLGYVLRRSIVA